MATVNFVNFGRQKRGRGRSRFPLVPARGTSRRPKRNHFGSNHVSAHMDDQLAILLERAARYRNAARSVACDPARLLLLSLAADYVSLVRLMIDHPHLAGSAIPLEALPQPKAALD